MSAHGSWEEGTGGDAAACTTKGGQHTVELLEDAVDGAGAAAAAHADVELVGVDFGHGGGSMRALLRAAGRVAGYGRKCERSLEGGYL